MAVPVSVTSAMWSRRPTAAGQSRVRTRICRPAITTPSAPSRLTSSSSQPLARASGDMRHQAVTYRVLRCRELRPTVSHACYAGPAPRPDLLRGALLLALLGSEDQDAAGKH